jgi:Rrf2 family transcriptional regulator, nitric oxide-sensitive transcriptional repressor
MQLTRYTDYGLRILMYLAAAPEGRSASIGEVCDTFDISRNHVNKIVHQLGKEGFIVTQRGKGGGFRLALPASHICIGDVVRKLEATLLPVDCRQPKDCILLPSCQLRLALRDAMQAFLTELDRYALADMVAPADVVRLFPGFASS